MQLFSIFIYNKSCFVQTAIAIHVYFVIQDSDDNFSSPEDS